MSKRSASSPPLAATILPWLQQRTEELAVLLAELIAIPTENPPGKNYRTCADLLEARIRQFGLDSKRFEPAGLKSRTADDPACLFASLGENRPTVYFHGHYDVVPAQSAEQFLPLRKEHFLFGRGSCDMKGGIVAMLYAMLALRSCRSAPLSGGIGLVLVPDEETGGDRGFSVAGARRTVGTRRHRDVHGRADRWRCLERKSRRAFIARARSRKISSRRLAAPRRKRI